MLHSIYVGGTMGAGKTLTMTWVAMRYAKRRKANIYCNFSMKTGKTLYSNTDWPLEEKAIIILDELLLLQAYDALPQHWLADGLTMARKRDQVVFLGGQGHRPPFHNKFMGAIQEHWYIKSLNLFGLGRFVWIRRSQEPFVRQFGVRSPGTRFDFMFIPKSHYGSYSTKEVFYVPKELSIAQQRKRGVAVAS